MRWWIFIRERFEPLSHLVMLSALFAANVALASSLTGVKAGAVTLLLLFVIEILFFFHLRLFDEIKDFETDREINQTRPLPRGLIAMGEFKVVLWSVIAVEIALAAVVSMLTRSAVSFYFYVSALFYSLLMYREFFVGSWLRPQMELYAISHTLVSGLFASFLFLAVSPWGLSFARQDLLLSALMNWMVFNVFEFARKTFAPSEERPHVESYSLRLGGKGAVLITLIFVCLAFFAVYQMAQHLIAPPVFIPALGGVSSIVAIAGLVYAAKPSLRTAKLFRGVSSAYLILFNLVIALGL